MIMRYAKTTKVTVARSRVELEDLLGKHGATQRASITDDLRGTAGVAFSIDGRHVRLEMRVPTYDSMLNPKPPPRGWWGWSDPQRKAWARKQHEQIARSRWRGLLLRTKAKLEAIQDGMSTVDAEFLAALVMPDGRTVGEVVGPQITAAYQTGVMPPLLPPATEGT